MIKVEHFCRQWIIFEPGTNLTFPAATQFEIKEVKHPVYEFIPITADCPLQASSLSVAKENEIPESEWFKHGERLPALLKYETGVTGFDAIYFSLNSIGKRRFIISIHPVARHHHGGDGGEMRELVHGGPHGVDD